MSDFERPPVLTEARTLERLLTAYHNATVRHTQGNQAAYQECENARTALIEYVAKIKLSANPAAGDSKE